jgi:uncharacterized protein YbaA (DUF1428 family)
MAKYVDGYVLVIPKDKTEEYKKMAEIGRDSWMKNGALEFYETRGADLSPMEMGDMKTRNFSEMTGAGENDTVWFSFVVFKSKEHRDAVNAIVNEEMSQLGGPEDFAMPFDMRKMAFGGFQVEVEG